MMEEAIQRLAALKEDSGKYVIKSVGNALLSDGTLREVQTAL